MLQKEVIKSGVPDIGGPLNAAVRLGPMFFVSGLPPFGEEFAAQLRDARANGKPIPAFPDLPFEEQARLVMDHMKMIVEATGSTMDHLLKVNVWLKDQKDAYAFDKIYRTYFSNTEALPARTRLQAGGTPLGCALEVEAVGYIPGASW